MFSLSALPLPAAASLPAILPAAVPAAGQSFGSPETLAETADTPPTLTFDALLALQTVTPQVIQPAATGPAIPATILQQTGKILPDPANPLAALVPQPTASSTQPSTPATAATATPADEDSLAHGDADDAVLPELVLPDAGLIAAIFTAPQRLAPAPDAPQQAAKSRLTTTFDPAKAPQPTSPRPVQQAAPSAPAPSAAIGAAAVALAQTADIEQDQTPLPAQPLDTGDDTDAEQASRPTISTTATLAASATRAPRAAPPTTNRIDPAADAPERIAVADAQDAPAQTDWTAQDITVSAFAPSANAAPETQPSAPVRHDARVEKIDFATLVENLSRAREEASPRTVNVAVTNTDFGRVSLRFDQDDKGLSVAMTSADPGFARAVSATAEAATANNANSQPEGQPKPQTGTNAQGDTPRQQSQQQAQQADRFAPGTPARASQTARAAADDAAPDDGIYA